MISTRTGLIKSNTSIYDDREDLLLQVSRLKLDLDIYKSKCKELELSLNSQANSFKLELQKERKEKERLKEELKALKDSMKVGQKDSIPIKVSVLTSGRFKETLYTGQARPKTTVPDKRVGDLSEINPLESVTLDYPEHDCSVSESLDFSMSTFKSGARYNLNNNPDLKNIVEEDENVISIDLDPLSKPEEKEIKTCDTNKAVPSFEPAGNQAKLEDNKDMVFDDEEFVSEIVQEPKNDPRNSIVEKASSSEGGDNSLKTPEGSLCISAIEEIAPHEQKQEIGNYWGIIKIERKIRKNIKLNELSNSIVASHKLIHALNSQPAARPDTCLNNSKETAKPSTTLLLTLPSFGGPLLKPVQPAPIVTLPPKPKKRLFEEFFIIGAPPTTVDSVKITDMTYLPPTTLFQYPNLPENLNCEKRKSVKDFAFPKGLKVRIVNPTESMSEAQGILYGKSPALRDENTFIFTLNGLDVQGKRVHDGNKTGWIYCICLKFTELMKRTDGRIACVEKILCFMTYYEYFECFFRILNLLRDVLRLSRISAAKKYDDPAATFEARILAEIEHAPETFDHTLDVEPILISLYNTTMNEALTQITISPTQEGLTKYVYSVPKVTELSKSSAAFFCPLLFGSLDLDKFYDVLCSIYLEHCVIFVSENLNVLTSSILGYCSLLKPFKWENIVIPIVPDICLELLEAPVPCLMGVQRSALQGKRLAQTMCTQETVIVLLDSNEIIRCVPAGERKSLETLPRLGDIKTNIEKTYEGFAKSVPANYHITQVTKKAVEDILNKVEAGISKAILNYLPLMPPRTPNNEVDLAKVKASLIGHVKPVDEEFAKMFCETQMFATYVDESDKERLSRIISKY